MAEPLRVLLVEDSPTDETLVLRALRRAGRPVEHERVEEAGPMRAALERQAWDVVISDWSMPKFSARGALATLRELDLDLPFIIVSGTIGEEAAVEAMRAGAHDYVLKDKLARLLPAVEREIRERVEREARRRAEAALLESHTERKRADEALRISQARLSRLAQSGIIGITISDDSGKIVDANGTFLSMLGFTAEDLAAGALDWERLTPRRWSELNQQIGDELARHGRAPPREKEYFRKDGTRVPVLVGIASLEPPHVISVTVELTELKRTERALRMAEARFAHLSESGIIGIAFTNLDGFLIDANDAYLKILGYSPEDLAAGEVHWGAITPEEWKAVDAAAVKEVVVQGVAAPWEKEMIAKDGRRVPVLVGMAMLEHPTCIAFMADLTARKLAEKALRQTEDQLRQAQKMEAVGRLAGGVAHDFNNILSVILSYAEVLIRDLGREDPMREDMEEIQKAAKRAADLTRQLLMFSRQQVLQPRTLDLNALLLGVDRMVRRIVGEDVELTSVPAADLGMVRVDSGSIEQVIMNLVVNARDAMPTGGKLTLETANVVLDDAFARDHIGVTAGPHVMLAVTDTGTGMDRATQSRIFEPFFTTKDKTKGTGLGLSTVFGIVQQSGGTVWVYSEPGKGTTFKVYLPRVGGSVHPQPESLAPETLRGSETILLVEDDDQVRAVALSILRRSGYHVIVGRNAGEALLLWEKHGPRVDLLLSDVVMPDLGGAELAKRLVRNRPLLKVLCMSGYTDDSIVRHGVLAAEIAFIQKPITPETLMRKVREVLDAPPR